MLIKDIIAQVRAKVDPENLEKINSLLSDCIRAESDLIADRTSANEESKSRKEKIRELEATIATTKTELEAANKKAADIEKEKTELGTYKEKWESQQSAREAANKAEWDKISKKFAVKETDKSYNQITKIKKYYTLTDNLTPEQIAHNLEMAKQHEELGLFEASADPPKDTPKGNGGTDNPIMKQISPFGATPTN